MIVRDKTDSKIEQMKMKLGLTGDVYLYKGHFIENLASHKRLIPTSTAVTIGQAYDERVSWEQEQAEKRRIAAERYRAEHPEEFEEEEHYGGNR